MINEERDMENSQSDLKVAIVCDWLTNQGGAERVVLELHRMFPEAPIYTSVYNPDGSGMEAFADADVRTSFIQHLPWAKTHHQLYPVLRRWAFQGFDFSEFDMVISSSGAEAKGILTNPEDRRRKIGARKNTPTPNSQLRTPIHINYCHSPTHYYWVRPNEYLQSSTMGWLGKVLRMGLRIFLKPMRRWDYRAAQRPDIMIANSSLTKERIERFYDRESEVVFPPVDTDRFSKLERPANRKGFVSLGRQVHYMRRDIAVAACSELGLLLRVIGRGPEHDYLRSIAGRSVEFYDDLSDEEVAEALVYAEGLISCGVEDFGITAVEALAAGTPVIALSGGGAEDIVSEPEHGVYFDEQSIESLKEKLVSFKYSNYDSVILTKRAEQFSADEFRKNLNKIIQNSTIRQVPTK